MVYRQKYDHESHLVYRENYLDYFKYDGINKPQASNEDMRISYANCIRFLDDIFGEVVQSIKSTGQWDNTIVLFTNVYFLCVADISVFTKN